MGGKQVKWWAIVAIVIWNSGGGVFIKIVGVHVYRWGCFPEAWAVQTLTSLGLSWARICGLRIQEVVKGIKWNSLHHKNGNSFNFPVCISACFNHELWYTLKRKSCKWIFHALSDLTTDRKSVAMFSALTHWWRNEWNHMIPDTASSGICTHFSVASTVWHGFRICFWCHVKPLASLNKGAA